MKNNKVRFAVVRVENGRTRIRFIRETGRIKVRTIRKDHLDRINRLIVNHPAEDIYTYLTPDGQETELYNQ